MTDGRFISTKAEIAKQPAISATLDRKIAPDAKAQVAAGSAAVAVSVPVAVLAEKAAAGAGSGSPLRSVQKIDASAHVGRESEPAAPTVAKPRRVRAKHKPKKPARWSAARQRVFLATLAECANVKKSASAAQVSETTVYRKRRDSADFRALWEAAMDEGVLRLEVILLHRALYGVEEALWYGGKQVGTATRFDGRLALAIITARRNKQAARKDPEDMLQPEEPIESVRERMKLKLSEMNKRMGGAG